MNSDNNLNYSFPLPFMDLNDYDDKIVYKGKISLNNTFTVEIHVDDNKNIDGED